MIAAAIRMQCIAIALLILYIPSGAQDTRAFNQNASRSNHTRLSFAFTPVYSTALNTGRDSLLFRGSGAGFRFGGDYFFGKAGISFSSGFGSSSPSQTLINNFVKRTAIPQDQLEITKTSQQNIHLLLGPSIQVGDKVGIYAHAKGGLFINNGGLISIQQKGAQRAAYRNESTNKSVYPGLMTGLAIQYKSRSDIWSFGIGADYLNTRAEVNNFDARRGGGVEGLKLSRNITDVVAGISIRYSISSPRDHSSGQATGRRVLPTVNKREMAPRDAVTGIATGKRMMEANQDENPANENCGSVTKRTIKPDGTIEEMVFACPADAIDFAKRSAEIMQGNDKEGRFMAMKAQNNNTVRSNRSELKSILIEADVDGDGEYETDITSQFSDQLVIDEKGNVSDNQQKAGISTSHSNVRTRGKLQQVADGLYTVQATATLNNAEVPVQIVYKTKHDTVKNSINNVR